MTRTDLERVQASPGHEQGEVEGAHEESGDWSFSVDFQWRSALACDARVVSRRASDAAEARGKHKISTTTARARGEFIFDDVPVIINVASATYTRLATVPSLERKPKERRSFSKVPNLLPRKEW